MIIPRQDLNLCFQNKSKLSASKAIINSIVLPKAPLLSNGRKGFSPPEHSETHCYSHHYSPLKLLSRWFCSFVPLFIDGTFGNKSWGCCGSARIYITLQCQNDKHCADVPQDSHPVCLRPWHIATTEYISSASRRCSMSSVTFLFRQTSGTKINQNQKLVAFKNNIMIPFQNVHQSYNGSMLGEARSETIKMSPWKPIASSPAQLSPQANSC